LEPHHACFADRGYGRNGSLFGVDFFRSARRGASIQFPQTIMDEKQLDDSYYDTL
jgi:hypothetical protein